MSADLTLFPDPAGPRGWGRVRKGLEADIRKALEDEAILSRSGVAALRVLADQIDKLDHRMRHDGGRPYDRVPLAGLIRQFGEDYDRTFAVAAGSGDPLTRALADFAAAENRDREGSPSPE